MNILYKADHNLEHKKLILNGLQAYNESKTGKKEFEMKHIYIFEEDKLVGACSVVFAWDWVHFGDFFYGDIEVLKTIVNHMINLYKDKAVGIQYNTHIETRKDDFIKCGFYELSKLKDMPIGCETGYYFNEEMNFLDVTTKYQIQEFEKVNENHNKIVKEKIQEFNELNNTTDKKVDLEFVAFDGDNFVGGIYGYIELDYVYVNLLFVNDNYRGNKVATKLMNLIEEEGKKRGIKNIYLGTCDFQAYDLYVKLGYFVSMTIKDFPKGFNEYTFIKEL